MRYLNFITISLFLFFCSCTSKKNVVYLQNLNKYNSQKINLWNLPKNVQPDDVLRITITSAQPDATLPYNIFFNNFNQQNSDLIKLDGYVVSSNYTINLPVLGIINVKDKTIQDLEVFLKNLLIEEGHFLNVDVTVKFLNSKFTVLGEVRNPGTYTFFDNNINLFQALGYAGDLTENARRNNISVIREVNNIRKTKILDLTDTKIMDSEYYSLRNNDVIIVNPNFNKIKSGGFIGSPQSIASISSILLSITLLIINK